VPTAPKEMAGIFHSEKGLTLSDISLPCAQSCKKAPYQNDVYWLAHNTKCEAADETERFRYIGTIQAQDPRLPNVGP
jgi:hypothetical protein